MNQIYRDWPIDDMRQWIECDRRSMAWVARKIGCSRQWVRKLCEKHEITKPKPGGLTGEANPFWRGGRMTQSDGYILIYCPDHPAARSPKGNYVLEHRLVMEKHLGRYLTPNEVVHHIDGNIQNNRIENLRLFDRNGDHLRKHLEGKPRKWTKEWKVNLLAGGAQWRSSQRELKRGEKRQQQMSRQKTT